VDGQTFKDIEEYGLYQWLSELAEGSSAEFVGRKMPLEG